MSIKIECDSLEELRKIVGKDCVAAGTHTEKRAETCPWCGDGGFGSFTFMHGFKVHVDCYSEIAKAKGND